MIIKMFFPQMCEDSRHVWNLNKSKYCNAYFTEGRIAGFFHLGRRFRCCRTIAEKYTKKPRYNFQTKSVSDISQQPIKCV